MHESSNNGFSLIADFDNNDESVFDFKLESTDNIPVLPLRNMVLFPGVFLPISIGRPATLKLVREAEKNNSFVAVVCQKDPQTDHPEFNDLHNIGVVGRIVKVLEMPDHSTTAIVQGFKRMELTEITGNQPYLKGKIEIRDEEKPEKNDKEFTALVDTCKDLTVRFIKTSEMINQETIFAIRNLNAPLFVIDFLATNLPLKKDEKIQLLSINSLKDRGYRLLEILNREVQLAEIKASIQMRTREDIDQQQRE